MDFIPRAKLHRRKKKSQGNEILDKLAAMRTQLDHGLFCKRCNKWQEWKKLSVTYEIQGEWICRVWWCPCGSMIKSDAIWERVKDGTG
jgi:hypothetical protein